MGGALAHQAQSVYVSLGSAEQAIARRAFLSMVRLGEGTKDTRRRAPITEMVARGQSERRVLAVLRRFAEPGSRLVSLLAGSGETTTSEVAHEALFDHWRLLQEWLDKGRDDLRFERQLNEAATEWRGRNEAEGLAGGLHCLRSFARVRGPSSGRNDAAAGGIRPGLQVTAVGGGGT